MRCQSCRQSLVRSSTPRGFIYLCESCGGRCATLPVLRRSGATRAFLAQMWNAAIEGAVESDRACPSCYRTMAAVTTQISGADMGVEVCPRCQTIWFDPNELESVPLDPPPPAPPARPEAPPAVREKLALARIRMENRPPELTLERTPEAPWHWLPGLLGLPVEIDAPPSVRRPWGTWIALCICVLASLPVLLAQPETAQWVVREWGFIPALWWRDQGMTLVSSFFLHGSFFHLVGNMYFLYVFGDNVEDHLGHAAFLLLMILGAVFGSLAQGLLGYDPTVPCIGASGGISTVVGFYAIAFPHVRLGLLFRLGLIFRWLTLTAGTALMLLILYQAVGGLLQATCPGIGVGYLAHLGGLAVGVAAGLYHRRAARRAQSPSAATAEV